MVLETKIEVDRVIPTEMCFLLPCSANSSEIHADVNTHMHLHTHINTITHMRASTQNTHILQIMSTSPRYLHFSCIPMGVLSSLFLFHICVSVPQ